MFDFEGAALKQLRRLAREGHLQLILSLVVCKEVESHIETNTTEAMAALNKFQKKARPFKSLGENVAPFFASYDVATATKLALSVWEAFLTDTDAVILDPDQANISEILNAYFSGNPPFGEKKKKSEFPDAIALSSLLSYLKNNKKHAYVVGSDSDTDKWCTENNEFATSVKSIRALLDLFNKEKQPELTSTVFNQIIQNKAELIESLKNTFTEFFFSYDPNYEADVEILTVENMELGEPEIIEVDVYHSIISLQATIKFKAHISGPNYDNAIWDSEDKEYFIWDNFSTEIDFEEHYDVSFKLEPPDKNDALGAISQVEFDGSSESIMLYLEDEYPYKLNLNETVPD